MSWHSHVDQLLYEGETVLADTRGRNAGVVVTSHRLLVFTPDLDGANVRTVERPNVTGVTKDASGDTRWLMAGLKWLATGIALAVVGLLLDLDGIVGSVSTDDTASQVGVGWIGDLFSLFNTAFSLLDDLLLFGGLLAVIGGMALLGWYWQTRSDVLRIDVAGGPAIEVPGLGFRGGDLSDLADAIDPEIAAAEDEAGAGDDPFDFPVADDSNESN